MRKILASGMLAVAIFAGTGATGPARAQNAPLEAYLREGAQASRPTATIAYGSSPLQVGDLRLPAGKGPFPVAVVMHGGCFMAGIDKREGMAAFAEALTSRGVATWNIEYRRVGDPGGGWPGTFQDVAAAVDRLATLAPTHNLDLSRVTYVGHSAGAFFALWAASRGQLPAPWGQPRIRPASVVAIDGPGTLGSLIGVDAMICGQPVIVPLMGGTPAEKPAEYRLASPQDHLPLGLPQLLVQAELGMLMQPYEAASRAAGDSVQSLAPPNANHFDVVTPSTVNGRAVVDFIVAKALPKTP